MWENNKACKRQTSLEKDKELVSSIVTAKSMIDRFFWSILSFLLTNLVFLFVAFLILIIYLISEITQQFAFAFIATIVFIIFYNILFLSYLLTMYIKGLKQIEQKSRYLLLVLDVKADELLPFSFLGSLRKSHMLEEMLLEQ
ncbi:MPN163 family protein [Mycoplasmoides pneumoniae]